MDMCDSARANTAVNDDPQNRCIYSPSRFSHVVSMRLPKVPIIDACEIASKSSKEHS